MSEVHPEVMIIVYKRNIDKSTIFVSSQIKRIGVQNCPGISLSFNRSFDK